MSLRMDARLRSWLQIVEIVGEEGWALDDVLDDGSGVLFRDTSQNQVFEAPLDRSVPPRLVTTVPAGLDQVHASPDGKWIAYNTRAPASEVFIVPRSGTGGRWQVSSAGGVQPIWRGDSREIYYLDPLGRLNAVSVDAAQLQFRLGTPRILFQTNLQGVPDGIESYRATADGQRFLFRRSGAPRPTAIRVIVNWPALLEAPKP
jgi:hypothetical protein